MTVGQAFEDVLEIGERFDIVELGGGDERADGGPALGTAIGSGKEVVFSAEGDRADGALDRVGVEFDTAVSRKQQRASQCVRA